MSRNDRQIRILELISKHDIDKQETLVRMLNAEGVKATQATVSRDIKELGLVKVLGDNKRYKYIYHAPQGDKSEQKLFTLFKSSVLSISSSENIVVLKTLPGSANSAAALIDKMNVNDVLGVVA
ncbi:MAG TPA: arginine repressor, partial [Eubacteriales bacterium]|nr:arginine repressor [Eubacteriales bacterium]